MAEALACLPGPSTDRASWLTFRAEIATYAGDLAEADAALREAEATGRALGDRRSLAYAAWVGALLATVRRDAAVATQRFLLAEQQGGVRAGQRRCCCWSTPPARSSGSASPPTALAYLERAETQAAELGFEVVALLPRGLYESRYRRPGARRGGAAAYQGHEERQMAPRDEWRILLERAWAARRARGRAGGDDAGGPRLRGGAGARARRPAGAARARPGGGARPARDGRGLGRRARGRASASRRWRGDARGASRSRPTGARSTCRPAAPATLVKLLAWPATRCRWRWRPRRSGRTLDAATGRRRLRNVLNRIRTACGELVVRDGEALALGDHVEVDMRLFPREAPMRWRADGGRRGAGPRRSLRRYGGELLPGDRYAAWAAAPREELRRRRARPARPAGRRGPRARRAGRGDPTARPGASPSSQPTRRATSPAPSCC